MSIKSAIQIIIFLIILGIIGGVYLKYFDQEKLIVEETIIQENENENEKAYQELEKKIIELEKKNIELKEEVESKIDELNKKQQSNEIENKKKLDESNIKLLKEEKKLLETSKKIEEEKKLLEEEKKLLETSKKIEEEKKLLEEEKKLLETTKKIEEEKNIKNNKKKIENKKKKINNTVKDVEYISTDTKGNKFRILATSAKSNKNNNDLLDLKNVRGVVTSEIRDPIYIISDFGQYNTINSNSIFYQNVIINHIDKEISCENFDIDMETNMAIAYNNVIVTDPKSIMKAGIITFDLKTKDININPENVETKVKVITN